MSWVFGAVGMIGLPVAGFAYDRWYLAPQRYVKGGHRAHAEDPVMGFGQGVSYTPLGLLLCPLILYGGIGALVSQQIDRRRYPERWILGYETDEYKVKREQDDRDYAEFKRRLGSNNKGKGSGIPQFGTFFDYDDEDNLN